MELITTSKHIKLPEHEEILYFSVPVTGKWDPERALQLINQVMSTGHARIGIEATSEEVKWFVHAYESEIDTIANALQSFYQQVEFISTHTAEILPYYVYNFHASSPHVHPFKEVSDSKQLDPLVNIVGAMVQQLRADERIILEIRSAYIREKMRLLGTDYLNDKVGGLFTGSDMKKDSPWKEAIEKHQRPLFEIVVSLKIATSNKGHADYISQQIHNALNVYNTNYMVFVRPGDNTYSLALSMEELAILWHPPNEQFRHLKVAWAGATVCAPVEVRNNTKGILLGDNLCQGKLSPVHLLDADRTTHMNIIGKTGVGKSTFMHNLIHQDIALGRGVAVIDPHGELVQNVLRVSIPENRIDDVVVLDIANLNNPPPINPLNLPSDGTERLTATGQVLAILDKVGSDQMTDRIADTMSNVLLTLANERQPNVRDVGRLFSDIAYRKKLLAKNTNPVVEDFWYDFEDQGARVQRELTYPVLHRMRKFYRNPILYHILCHPEPLDFSKLIEDKKIILISLGIDESKLPKRDQEFLGAVLLTQLEIAHRKAAHRQSTKQQEDDKFEYYLYIDEVQSFTNASNSLEDILSGARKFGLRLIFANQFLNQLKGDLLAAVMGNVGATATFQIGLPDAKVLAPYYAPQYDADGLFNLDRFTLAAKVRYATKDVPPFTITTRNLPADPLTQEARETERIIRATSIQKYLPRTTEEIQAWLKKKYKRDTRPGDDQDNRQDDEWRTKDG